MYFDIRFNNYIQNIEVVGYDLLNEPGDVSKEQLNSFYNQLYQAIRSISLLNVYNQILSWKFHFYIPFILEGISLWQHTLRYQILRPSLNF